MSNFLRSPFTRKTTDHDAPVMPPRKKTIKSRIVGKKSQNSSKVKRDSPTPLSTTPRKRIKPSPAEPSPETTPVSPPEVVEKVFHVSGRKNFSIPDGPAILFAYENKYAEGGYCVEVTKGGKSFGFISAGGEIECRKLLVPSYAGRY
jgi:hypothetical protein